MSKPDDQKFNETLQRMLKTPPKHHADEMKGKESRKGSVNQNKSKKDGRATRQDERARPAKGSKSH